MSQPRAHFTLSDFDFPVPEALVAQRPLEQRDASRMLVLDRKTGALQHRKFLDLPEFLTPADLLVFNKSKVLKARLVGHRSTGGKVEIFLLKNLGAGKYECLVKVTAAQKIGLEITFGEGFCAKIERETANPMIFETQLISEDGRLDFWIDRFGRIPLPPYIHRAADGLDISRYQTVYASEPGSVAAPTAGLHFTPAILAEMDAKGIRRREVILHVGLGTFQPIKVDAIDDHEMHTESFSVPDALKAEIAGLKQAGRGRLVAVGTTSVRALESAARGKENETNLFLKPGEPFQWVDALFTNFHQPKSSLLVMLSAFVGSVDVVRETYAKAVEEKYRFFSYGDCMLVL